MLKLQQGDTIIEVLLAFTVFSLVSVGCMTVMAQGLNTSQRSLEIAQVRQHIESQVESLRAAQQAFAAKGSTQWRQLAPVTSLQDSLHFNDASSCPTSDWITNSRTFIMDPRTAEYVAPSSNWYFDTSDVSATTAFAQVAIVNGAPQSYGMWIERTYDQSDSASVHDAFSFVVRACWNNAGSSVPMQIETIVRLYEPSS